MVDVQVFDITERSIRELHEERLGIGSLHILPNLKTKPYVVVRLRAYFGYLFRTPRLEKSFADLDEALSYVDWRDCCEMLHAACSDGGACGFEIWHVVDEKEYERSTKFCRYLNGLLDSMTPDNPWHSVFACFDDSTNNLLWERYFEDDAQLFRFGRQYDSGDNMRCVFCVDGHHDSLVLAAYISTEIPSTFDALQQLRMAGGVCRG